MLGPGFGPRRHRRGRPRKPRMICLGGICEGTIFLPFMLSGAPISQGPPIEISPDELEALRLTYLEGLNQEEAASRMGISRGTLWRLLDSGRRKITQALVERRPIVIKRL